MSKQKIYNFLRDLTANNSKEWMDQNRKYYLEAKEIWLDQISLILKRLSIHDPKMGQLEPKKTIMRINTNRRFHPDKPIYKDNFAFSPSTMNEAAFYIHISPKETFIGGGFHNPDNTILKKIRDAIDYDGDQFKKIIASKEFQDFYGGLPEDPNQLKTSPRGFSEDHKHIDLLNRKSFTGIKPLTQKEFLSDNFIDLVEQSFVTIQPFNAYLQKAVDFEN
ncbi:MAG: DUF2461 domain-containing protein [Chitinophagales bacterium]